MFDSVSRNMVLRALDLRTWGQGCQLDSSPFRRRQTNCGFIRRRFDSGCAKASSEVASSAAERVATASQRARLSASYRRRKTRTWDKPRPTALFEKKPLRQPRRRLGTRDSSGWVGVRGGALRQIDRRRRTDSDRSVGPPRRGRVHSQEGAAEKARGGIGCKPVSPRSGAPKAGLAAKEETRQAAKSLLASVNAPGPTRSD